MDLLDYFLANMASKGCAPADSSSIIPDDKKRRYVLEGDHKRATNASYQLRIDGDYAVGWFRSFREGVTHKFSSYSKNRIALSAEQRQAQQKARELAQKQQADRIRAEQDAAAAKAQAIWDRALNKGSTSYLDRKRALLHGARVWKNLVVVPIKIGGKLTSLQFIAEDGAKRFLSGSELVGGYFGFASSGDDLSKIVICEGFATGDSIRQSTGMVVVAAINSGNLGPVADAMRKKYPDAELVLAADNDQWTIIGGKYVNVGMVAATEVCLKVGARMAWPEFANDDLGNKPTDFNDAYLLYGAKYVQDRISGAAVPTDKGGEDSGSSSIRTGDAQTDALPTDDHEGETGHVPPEPPMDVYNELLPSVRSLSAPSKWRRLLLRTEDGKIKGSSLRNAVLHLKFHEDFQGIFAFNEFHQNIMIVRCPPWERDDTFEPKRVGDVAVTNCAAELEKYGVFIGTDKVFKAIQSTAVDERFHPAREYFNGLKWDGQPRLDKWLTYYLGCEHEDADYLAFVGKKWLTAAVTRVYRPGCKFDHVLVIEGEQGLGKSTALRALATFGGDKEESYFTDSVTLSQIENKDTIMKMQGSIIVELSELSGFSKKEDEAIKSWVVAQFDDARLPYAREVTRFDRQFVLAATTNQNDYLKDPTGNRRYWPVLAKSIDMAAIKRDREQLWAEAVHWYGQTLYLGPTRDEERLANHERAKRMATDSWTDTVMRHVEDLLERRVLNPDAGFKVSEVMAEMGLSLRDRDDRAQRRIGTILRMCGLESKSVYNPMTKRTERLWVKRLEVSHAE